MSTGSLRPAGDPRTPHGDGVSFNNGLTKTRNSFYARWMAATVEYYDELMDSLGDPESLTVLVVAGASRDAVARALDVDLHEPVCHPWDNKVDSDYAAWALVEIDGGVLGVEYTGYGDPSVAALEAMSRDGAAAAVVRSNIEAHVRFGCARDAEVLFDAHEFIASTSRTSCRRSCDPSSTRVATTIARRVRRRPGDGRGRHRPRAELRRVAAGQRGPVLRGPSTPYTSA